MTDTTPGKYTEKLAHYIIVLLTLAIAGFFCWLFRSVLMYIILALLVAILSYPLFKAFRKIRIGSHYCPPWLGSVLSILVVMSVFTALFSLLYPLIRDISRDLNAINFNDLAQAASAPFVEFNLWASSTLPNVGPEFRIEHVVMGQLQDMLNLKGFSSVVGSVTSFVANVGIALFAVVFISFFFIKDPHILGKIISAVAPDAYVERTKRSVRKICRLLSRYFVGMTIEVLGVALLNFLGLLLIAKMGLKYSLGIGFMTGLLNIIPYLGPLFGGVLGVALSLVIKYACASALGLDVGFLAFVLVLVGIFVFTQLIDNYVYQPLIYSNSVNVHPLEIFIVFLMAGSLGGMVGMLVAIPAYTVIREIAKEFLSNVKAVRKLTGLPDPPEAEALSVGSESTAESPAEETSVK